ncbi:MAG: type II secretion system protein [Planctomycetota bacterium]
MTTCRGQRGFTLLEIIVVLGVLAILLGTAMPLVTAAIDADHRTEVQRELEELGTALDSYYYEHAAFPASLRTSGFFGQHLQPGVSNTAVIDPFGGADYLYSVNAAANTATAYSRGENAVDDGVANEEFVVVVHGAVPGTRRTMLRMRLIAEVLADFIESGGSVAGDWPTLRARIGLGADYDDDGFGTGFDWTASTYTLKSAGPDRVLGNGDDITL